ncbi:tumor necrosis factor receptor superfamily member 1A isoform X2 [Anoplopoma fimbria]|uniref:tumor necrosis factor receptor superfamily member 1A isoform X2 n=1 Tax=Anoplopoma fimbria TaxID=229290 RepID=UPI0023EC1020|nr:tumor necrosis factor receptor superfamily member 1A isoform X2 [Anoplopoma fimbria]
MIMEGAGHRGRWIKKAPVGTILLLMCMFIPTLTSPEPSKEQTCPPGDYPNGKGICCNKCPQGFKLLDMCNATGQRSNCLPCPAGQYVDQINYYDKCHSCRRCKQKHEVEVSSCESKQNTVCRCVDGYYKSKIDSETYECRRCKQCGKDEKTLQTCTSEKNTVCECKENYYRAKGKCAPCKNCSAECKHHCSTTPPLNTKAPKSDENLINIIAGVGVFTLVLLTLVVVITHKVTKRSTKKKLLKRSCPTSDVSPDSCKEVLVQSEEPSENMSVTAVPQSPVSEQEPSNLPDCVPLEIKIPDLIYMVLDLVPVTQVKRLVRSLGVNDTEIEQAEMDHRSCREAHYQMLRVWAERGSRAAGGGGRGRMLHWPLLHELLDTLRNIHLGQAAEELETMYGIQ